MDTLTVIVLLIIGAALIGLVVLLELRDRGNRHQVPSRDGEDDSVRERARAQQEGESARGQAAGMAYGSGIGGNDP
jgi:prephenate dehydrogenase